MAEHKPKDSSEVPEGRPELTFLKSKDAHEVVNPTSDEKAKAEAVRTNASSGSAGELALKGGLSREHIAARMAEQDDSISIDYGGGKTVSRLNPGTEVNMVTVGARAYDAKAILAQNGTPGGVGTDATNTTGSPDSAMFETDKSKIFAKPIEEAVSGVQATGLDFNSDGRPSNKLLRFVQSAAARAMSPETRQVAIQGIIDKALGVGEGLNLAKEEVKTTAMHGSLTAWKALNDGSVARYMAQPNTINEPLFNTVGSCLDAMKRDPHAVNNVLMVLGREMEAASKQYSQMSNHDRGVQDGKAMFWFINPSGSTEAGDLALKIADNAATHVDAAVMNTVDRAMKAAQELATSSAEGAQQTKQLLLDYLNSKGITGPQMQYAGIPKDYFYGMTPSEPLKASDTLNAMSKADDLGTGGNLTNRGVDAAGRTVKFSEESDIEVVDAVGGKPDSIWRKGWSVRGFEGEDEMGSTGILAKNFPRIDDAIFKDGTFPSMKTIDLSSAYYRDNPKEVLRKLNGYLDKIDEWNGQLKLWKGRKIDPDEIEQKVLHIGIPDNSMTEEQKQVFEVLGKRAKVLGIKVKVTVIK